MTKVKLIFSEYIAHFFDTFGFKDSSDLLASLFTYKFIPITITFSAVSAFIIKYTGLEWVTIAAFASLLIMELGTGLIAARTKGTTIESKKLSRFFLKVAVWMNVFFVVKTLEWHYISKDSDTIALVYSFLHSLILVYVSFEYLISVIENITVISGKSTNPLIKVMTNMLKNLLGTDKIK